MSKHRTTPSSRAAKPASSSRRASPHGKTPGEDFIETLDQPTDVLTFDANEHTEIQKDLGAIAAFRSAQNPATTSLYGDDDGEHTEVNADIDVNAARELARRRFGSQPSGQHPPAKRLSPQPTPVHTPANTFDADEKTEFGLDLNKLSAQANKPRTRFATTAAQAIKPQSVKPQPTGRASGVHPRVHRPHTGQLPAASAPHSTGAHPKAQQHPASSRISGQHPRATAPHSPQVSGAYPVVNTPRTSGAYPSARAPHVSGAYPVANAPHTSGAYPVARPQALISEQTEPAREALLPSEPTATLEPLKVEHMKPSPPAEPIQGSPQLGYIDLGLNSPLVAPRVRRQVEFLKEETGVDFDPMAMSSPNLNALVLAMGAQQANLQETAAALVSNESYEIIALHLKWGEPDSAPTSRMRLHYGAWGGFAGICAGVGLLVVMALSTGRALSSFGVLAALLPSLFGAIMALLHALQPRRVEALLHKSKLLPPPTTAPPSS